MAFDVSNALIMPSITDGMLETKQAVQQMASQKQANALLQQQADQQSVTFGQEQDDRQNAVNLATAQHVLASSNPRLALQQAASADPHVAQFVSSMTQDHGVDLSNTPDEDVRGMAQTAVDHFSSLLRKGPVQPEAKDVKVLKSDESAGYRDPQTNRWVTLQAGTPKAEQPSWGTPVDEVQDGKSVRAQYDKAGKRQVIAGASPYNAPSKTGGFDAGSAANTAEMIGKGQIPMLNGQALRTPWGQQVVSLLKQNYPDYNAAGYTSSASSLKGFTSGKESAAVRSLNVGIQHLDTLEGLSSALDNTNSPLFNKAANLWKQQTGQTAPNSFNGAKQIVSAEVVKAITGGGGGVTDREEAQHIVDSANSPQQLAEAIRTVRELFGGQLNGLQRTYEQGTGRRDFDRFLSPAAQRELSPYSDATPKGAPEGQPTQTATDAKGNKIGLINGQWKPLGK